MGMRIQGDTNEDGSDQENGEGDPAVGPGDEAATEAAGDAEAGDAEVVDAEAGDAEAGDAEAGDAEVQVVEASAGTGGAMDEEP